MLFRGMWVVLASLTVGVVTEILWTWWVLLHTSVGS